MYIDRQSNLVDTLKRSFFNFFNIVFLRVRKNYTKVLKESSIVTNLYTETLILILSKLIR